MHNYTIVIIASLANPQTANEPLQTPPVSISLYIFCSWCWCWIQTSPPVARCLLRASAPEGVWWGHRERLRLRGACALDPGLGRKGWGGCYSHGHWLRGRSVQGMQALGLVLSRRGSAWEPKTVLTSNYVSTHLLLLLFYELSHRESQCRWLFPRRRKLWLWCRSGILDLRTLVSIFLACLFGMEKTCSF